MSSSKVSTTMYRRPWLGLSLLIAPPGAWLLLVYIASLIGLLITAFWSIDSFTGQLVREFTFQNFLSLASQSTYHAVSLRTLGLAVSVTLIDLVLALPLAFFMAFVANSRLERFLLISVTLPLWSSYLVKAYAWRSVISQGGLMSWLVSPFGLEPIGYSLEATTITLAYLWFPFVVIPIYTTMRKVPGNLLEASSDLGAKSWGVFRSVILPLSIPGIVAGTIFSFSLTLGDYIAVKIVGGATQTLGTLIYTNVGTANNLPLATAIAFVPLGIIAAYLVTIRRTGALNNL
jgi:putative spermidine/putrescine transport system permease protein